MTDILKPDEEDALLAGVADGDDGFDLLTKGKKGVAVARQRGPIGRAFDWMESTAGKRVLVPALIVFAIAFPFLDSNEGHIDAVTNAFSLALLALGLNIVIGFTGLLDLGYAAFFAIGAYTYGVFSSYQVHPAWTPFWEPFQTLGFVEHLTGASGDVVHFTTSFWLMLPISAIVAAFFGFLFGAPTLRLKGDYLAIVTLGFGEIVPIVARNTPYLTNGAQGLNGVGYPSVIGYGSFGVRTVPYYYLGLVLIAFMIFVARRLKDSRIGRAWLAIREDEIAAEAMGINRARLKLLAFAIGAGFAGMTGSFYVAKLQTATPEMFGFPVSVMLLVMIVLGGMGSVAGVVLGAMTLQLLQSWFLQELTDWIHALGKFTGLTFLLKVDLVQSIELIFGIILVLMMLFRRQGLIPERRDTTALSHAQQTAVPTRGDIKTALPALHSRQLDPRKPILELTGIKKSFGGIKALRGVDITVEPGQIVAIIGPNGSGKTTVFNVITGLYVPDEGKVLLAGKDLTGLRPDLIVSEGIARTFQNLRVFPNLTLFENALIGSHSRTRNSVIGAVLHTPRAVREEAAARAKVLETLRIFGNRLMPRRFHQARTLSYANRRRLEIARALMTEPVLLLLDEPTAGMNQTETLELTQQIKGLRERGVSVLMIEHKLNVVNEIADKVVVLDHGDKIAEGLPAEIQTNKEVLRAYLGRAATAAAEAAAAAS
jgi:branched-chain amino acid transport system permease protein